MARTRGSGDGDVRGHWRDRRDHIAGRPINSTNHRPEYSALARRVRRSSRYHESELELSQLAVQDESPESEGTGGVVRVPDYIAISVLVVLAVWAVAEWIPRDKL